MACGDDQQPSIGEPVDAHRKGWNVGDDLTLAIEIEGNHLVRAPVREPKTVIVPAWRLGEDETAHQDSQVRQGRLLLRGVVYRV